jgi:decaprenylphospho-beta-D-ribofuranose 2-oxidase
MTIAPLAMRPATRVTLEGFSRSSRSDAWRVTPRDPMEIPALLAGPGAEGVIARGLGRSYGDAALNGGGLVLDATLLGAIGALDETRRTIAVQAGVSIGALLAFLARRGWTLPVVPATRHVTIGGAIAADIHGKNHMHAGTIGRHVSDIVLHAPTGTVTVTPESDRELFLATTGGMGLTGVISEATLRIEPASSTWVHARTVARTHLDAVLDALDERARRHKYSIAWIDGLARRSALGRGFVVAADPAAAGAFPPSQAEAVREFRPRHLFTVPPGVPAWLLNDASVALANRLCLLRARLRAARAVSADAVLMPLDAIERWTHLYGPQGFIQYQFAVPARSVGVLQTVMERLEGARCRSYFSTVKRLGAASGAPLSFPLDGWTLSLDVPARHENLARLLDECDELVAAAGGRVYLAKDGRMRPGAVRAMYPEVRRLEAVRGRVDPNRALQSDLSRRLGLF